MRRVLADLDTREDKDTIPPIIYEMAHRSFEAVEDILGPVEGNAVLVHGDIWLPNILIDPSTYAVTGIVDPSMARWDEREMDVVPMDWPWAGDYQFLMKAYQKQCPLREGWELRFAFHRFWFMTNAIFVIGPDAAKGDAENLKKLMDEQMK
jgi:fructosamine-3-kinase